MQRSAETRGIYVRTLAAALVTPLLTLIFAALATYPVLGFWGNAATQLLAFLGASYVGCRIARAKAMLAVSLGLCLTFGIAGLYSFLDAIQHDRSIRAPCVVLADVLASVLLALILSRRVNEGKRHRAKGRFPSRLFSSGP
jgi:hypothetical protein